MLYTDIPSYYTWDSNLKNWFKRQRGIEKVLGRMYTAHPSQNERFYVRVLLCHVHGPTSYEFLRTYEGQIFATFKEAVIARGLLSDDNEWERTLSEASLNCYPQQIRELFAIMLLHCTIKDPKSLFVSFFTIMAEDFAYQQAISREAITIEHPWLLAQVATNISSHLSKQNQSWDAFNLPPFDMSLTNARSMIITC